MRRKCAHLRRERNRGLPPNGIDFLLFQTFWRPWFPFTRLDQIMRGVRSMSIGR